MIFAARLIRGWMPFHIKVLKMMTLLSAGYPLDFKDENSPTTKFLGNFQSAPH